MLTLILAFLNLGLNLALLFWLVNKNCSQCHQEMSFKRIFTFQDKCEKCEDGDKQKSWWHFTKDQARRENE